MPTKFSTSYTSALEQEIKKMDIYHGYLFKNFNKKILKDRYTRKLRKKEIAQYRTYRAAIALFRYTNYIARLTIGPEHKYKDLKKNKVIEHLNNFEAKFSNLGEKYKRLRREALKEIKLRGGKGYYPDHHLTYHFRKGSLNANYIKEQNKYSYKDYKKFEKNDEIRRIRIKVGKKYYRVSRNVFICVNMVPVIKLIGFYLHRFLRNYQYTQGRNYIKTQTELFELYKCFAWMAENALTSCRKKYIYKGKHSIETLPNRGRLLAPSRLFVENQEKYAIKLREAIEANLYFCKNDKII